MINIKEDWIQFSDEDNFENALIKCAEPLINDKIITIDYVEQIFKLIEVEGCYFVLIDKIAFAHASPDQGSLAEGLSVLILDQEVTCNFEDIKVILLLSGYDNIGHLHLLQHLAKRLRDGKHEMLLNATNSKDVLALLT